MSLALFCVKKEVPSLFTPNIVASLLSPVTDSQLDDILERLTASTTTSASTMAMLHAAGIIFGKKYMHVYTTIVSEVNFYTNLQ